MSAIAGIVHLNKEPIPNSHGYGMMEALQKYPADDAQMWQQDNIVLGCHAQWITPESVGEQLPYSDTESQLAITADAIIDNRKELFDLLQVDKEKRKTLPDSQLILLAYQKWGEASPKYLIGDFAFMIWDGGNNKLFGARDYSGTRTLYYAGDNQRLAFCTVIQPLLTLPNVEKRLNEQWIADFLAIPDMLDTVDTTSTVYEAIKQVPPSHSITVTEDSLKLTRYVYIDTESKLILKSNEEYEEAFKEVFGNAVNEYMRTDQKVGSRLSGGLDSGSVTGFAARSLGERGKKLHTFSYVPVNGFEDWTHKSRIANERPYIQSTVDYVGNIEQNYLSFPNDSPYSVIDDWLDVIEMPYKYFENSYWISGLYRFASEQGIKVMLTGDRGNYSVSWGNAIDIYTNLFRRFHWIKLFKEINQFIHVKGTGRKRVLQVIGKNTFREFTNNKQDFSVPLLINPEFAKKSNVFERIRSFGINEDGSNLPNSIGARKNQFEKLFYRTSGGTSDTKFSLSNSIWNRDPTNDLRVVRFCLSVPDSQYVQYGMDRALIRRSTKGILPDKVRLNHLYKGIQSADSIQRMIPDWSAFINESAEVIRNPQISEYINTRVLESALKEVRKGPEPELIYDMDFKLLIRSIILSRFIQKYAL
ncbi:asparagine synthetase B [Oceanobacillus zhaokaii]|uniref:asparagine synthase (glutamine-hydrolyzing) n=1 Tax=Oceanobacillus zhaokaii TaxID=2052660 RepID=A0A345PL87_9BACI|nr:asparagine synthase-related protein [Oceanobacillus zhaokaii]AXI10767.1 asparagine synthetase B [Oceanobacillus zhaokaii]